MNKLLDEIIEQHALTKADARKILLDVTSGVYNPSQVAAFMTMYMMRSITVDELQGFRDAMLELCIPVRFDEPVMDVCGTGGDGKNTFNISTLSSFVVAAAGQPVAKHGNYGVSSVSGSSNILEFFGFKFTNNIDQLKRSIDKANICFMHAPLFHPAMKNVAPIRKELGVKTFFNMLGPIVNPAFPRKQFVGVFSLELARKYAYLYQHSDKEFGVLHGIDGYDEVSLTSPFKFFSNEGEFILDPEDLALQVISPSAIHGGETVESSAKIFKDILEGRGTSAQNDVVIANAAMALYTANRSIGLQNSVERAREALISGKALEHFKILCAI